MNRHIIISWVSVLFGFVLQIAGEVGKSDGTSILSGLGTMLIILPNVIWILTANKLASASIKKSPSLFILGLTITAALAALLGGSFDDLTPISDVALLTVFISLIASSIMVSHRIVDAEDSPRTDRKGRVFLSSISFLYILIGMFFVAPTLRKMKIKVG